jgi:hypothetical protein
MSNVTPSGRRLNLGTTHITFARSRLRKGQLTGKVRGSLERAFIFPERPDRTAGPLLLWFASLAKEKLAGKKRGVAEPTPLKNPPRLMEDMLRMDDSIRLGVSGGLGFPDVR